MTNRLRFHPLTVSDLREAIQWYEDISEALSDRFRLAAEEAFDDIEAHPERYAKAFDDIRFLLLKRFPYLVLFREAEHDVFVLGVFHASSDPEKWRRREDPA